jgi:PAS domain S-box-containing protein
MAEVLAPESRPHFQEHIGLIAGQQARSEETVMNTAGTRVEVECSSVTVEYLGEPAIVTVFHDISAQKQKERAFYEGARRFRRLMEGGLIGVTEKEGDRIVEANDVFLNLIGRTREELNRGELTISGITPPDYAELERKKEEELVATGECKPFEKEYLRPDGSRVPVLLCASMLTWEPRWRAIGFVIDVTDRRRLDELRAEKLRLESIGVLAAGMAHNLNNALTAVIGNASLLLDREEIASGPRARPVMREILDSGQRAAQLTAQLLAYSGQGRFAVGATNIREIIATEVERLRTEIPGNIRVTVELAENLPVVVADATQLRNAMVGLVTNAVEAIGDRSAGAIEIRGRVERVGEKKVYSRSGEAITAGEYCVVEVSDNGSGMESEILAHVFDPFFTTKFPGRGLGLAAAAGTVAACGGAILVKSTPGAGSVFQVYLPVHWDIQAS